MPRIVWTAYRVIAGLLTLVIAAANMRLYHPSRPASPDALAESKAQLAFIRASLDSGSGAAMQSLFPEGYFFTYAQYGLIWAELVTAHPDDADLRAQAIREARWALAALKTPDGTAPFPPSLDPPYGVFYNGWTAWLEGSTLRLETPDERGMEDIADYEARCDALASASSVARRRS